MVPCFGKHYVDRNDVMQRMKKHFIRLIHIPLGGDISIAKTMIKEMSLVPCKPR